MIAQSGHKELAVLNSPFYRSWRDARFFVVERLLSLPPPPPLANPPFAILCTIFFINVFVLNNLQAVSLSTNCFTNKEIRSKHRNTKTRSAAGAREKQPSVSCCPGAGDLGRGGKKTTLIDYIHLVVKSMLQIITPATVYTTSPPLPLV